MVYVTGLGIATNLGIGRQENKNNYLSASANFSTCKFLQTRHTFPVAEVPISNPAILKHFNIQSDFFSRTSLLGLLALEEAISYLPANFRQKRIAFVNSSTTGNMAEIEDVYMDVINSDTINPAYYPKVKAVDCADVAYKLADFFQLDEAYIMNISTACSSSSNAIHLGKRLIQSKQYDIVICGGTDALSKFTLNGFYSLKNVDTQLSKPFDENRNGLNLGEGAGYLILESKESMQERGAKIIACLAGSANINEAHHPSAPSPNGEGAYKTMNSALKDAEILPKDIVYINAHGTATLGNDGAEIIAIENLFGTSNYPYFNSTKTLTGHTLAASGVIESILSIFSMEDNIILPNLRFEQGIQGVNILPTLDYIRNIDIPFVLNNSFGFGGSNVSIVLKKA